MTTQTLEQTSIDSAMMTPNLSTPIDNKMLKECEEFLQEARAIEATRKNKVSVLAPYHEQILCSYDNKIKVTTILKVLKGKGVKTSYGNLRSYISSNRGSSFPKTEKKKTS